MSHTVLFLRLRQCLRFCVLTVFLCCVNVPFCNSGAVNLDTSNIDGIIKNNDLVLINFYADWCRFSNMLAPIYDEGADKVAEQLSGSKVLMGKVDCDAQAELGTRFHVTKYPTIKYVQHGVVSKKEYRGQRSAEAFLQFVREQIKDPIQEVTDLEHLSGLEEGKRHVVGFFQSNQDVEYETFQRISRELKEDCSFHAGFGEIVENERKGVNVVKFRGPGDKASDPMLPYTGPISDYSQLHTWAVENCSPLVREITFENAEELTEEGLPFLILFRAPGDEVSLKEYNDLVVRELMAEKDNVNFLVADGIKFAHPLAHLGKSKNDLPLIAVDSFRHMYLFPKYENMKIPGKMKQFLQDLYSGKLHREFHYGPDKPEENTEEEHTGEDKEDSTQDTEEGDVPQDKEDKTEETQHIPRTEELSSETKETSKKPTRTEGPPESQFAHLGPSKNRYTILRDEF